MRVCLICNQIAAWGKIGGYGSMARMVGRELVKRGVDVTAVCRRRSGQRRVESLDGMRVIGLRTFELLTSTSSYKEINADIYHSHEATIGTWLAQRAMPHAKHIVTCIDPRDDNDWKIEFKHSTLKRKLIYPGQRYYEGGRTVASSVARADKVCCQTRFIIPKTMRMYGLAEEPEFLPNPIYVPERIPTKADKPTCCFVGRFDPRKRPELFFKCVQDNPDVHFVAVGRAHDRGYDDYLRRHYGDLPNLELTGFVDPWLDDKLTNIYARSWVLVNTAAREGLPATFQEACAQGCALLSAVDPDGMTSQFGLRVDDDDFGTALNRLLQGDQWIQLGRRAYDYVKATFDAPVAIEKHLEIYDRLMRTSKSDASVMVGART